MSTSSTTTPPPPPPPKHACRVGLYNQGATCYLNSLLQLLFHTTYFRSAVYKMSTGSDDLSQLPKALQLLFYQMQERDTAIETKVLTDTFGWDNGEVMVQQDIHELITLLRENLENKMKGTRAEGAINRLFTGVSEKYFACLDKSYTSRMRETFYDVQLQVQGFSDLVSSLRSLLVVEPLTGSNKYKVEEEGKPPVYKDAETGTRFLKFPPVIVCHLKRIDIDLESANLEQKKINTPFHFPDELDLTEYEAGLPPDYNVKIGLDDSQSPAVYDLYGVIVHRGGVRSGHYFCYLRQFDQEEGWGDWVEYDDECVRVVDHHTAVTKNFGEYVTRTNAQGYQMQLLSPQNAYILAYVRRAETPKVLYPEKTDNIPKAVQDEFKEVMRLEEAARREAEIAGRRVFVSFFTDETIDRHVRSLKTDIAFGREPVAAHEFQKNDAVSVLLEFAAQLSKAAPTNVRLWLCENRGTQAYGHGWRVSSTGALPRGSVALSNSIAEEVSKRSHSEMPAGAWNIAVYVEVARVTVKPNTTNAALFATSIRQSSQATDEDARVAVMDARSFRFDPRDPTPTMLVTLKGPHTVGSVTFRVHTSSKTSSNAFRCEVKVILRSRQKVVGEETHRFDLSAQRTCEYAQIPFNSVVADEVEIQRRRLEVVYQYSATPDAFVVSHVQVHVPQDELTDLVPKGKLEFVPTTGGAAFVQVKYFNHEQDSLVYAGSCMLPGIETFRASLPILCNITGAPMDGKVKLTLLEERSKTEAVEINLDTFPSDVGVRTGSILIVQQAPDQIPLCYRHPRVDAYLKTFADTRHVNIRRIEAPDKVVAMVPMQLHWYYSQVVDAIGKALQLKPDYLRFYCSMSYRHPKPREEPERSDTQERLQQMMLVQQWETSDLWLEELPMTRDELESFAQGSVTIANERGVPVEGAVDVKFRLPNSATAFDVVADVMRATGTPWEKPVALVVIMDKVIKQHLVVKPDPAAPSQSIHRLFRQRAGRVFEIRPFTPPGPEEMTFYIAIGQYQGSPPMMHGTPFLLNLPLTTTPPMAADILVNLTGTTPEEMGDKYSVMMYTTGPLYFPDDQPLKNYWESTEGGRQASLMLNKRKPKEKPGSRYVSYNDVALSLEKKKSAAPRKSSGAQSESP